ncbi:MAG: 3'-5' exonuclease [Pseudomonadota bacterium]|nr:3'-5' exonuclease [Pseudomonadota bacterium]
MSVLEQEKSEAERIVVLDLEATCWADGENVPIDKMETIEIGCVLCDLRGNIYDEFSTFVRPVQHPILSLFCTELTKIKQQDVDNAPRFLEAMTLLDRWAANRHSLWCSWGYYDFKLLDAELARNGGQSLFIQKAHVNLKKAWRRTTRQKRNAGLGAAIRFHELSFEGEPHRALSDARNTARLLKFIPYEEIALQLSTVTIPSSSTNEG